MLSFPILKLMPEPRHDKTSPTRPSEESQTGLSDQGPKQHIEWMARCVYQACRHLSFFTLFKNRNMALAFPIFFVWVFRGVSLRLLLQYTSVRFGWELSQVSHKRREPRTVESTRVSIQTNAIITIVAGVDLLLFSLVLPSVIRAVNTRFTLHPQALNLIIVRISIFILLTGSLLLGLALSPSLLIACKFIHSSSCR